MPPIAPPDNDMPDVSLAVPFEASAAPDVPFDELFEPLVCALPDELTIPVELIVPEELERLLAVDVDVDDVPLRVEDDVTPRSTLVDDTKQLLLACDTTSVTGGMLLQ